jgi:hypothetical protein
MTSESGSQKSSQCQLVVDSTCITEVMAEPCTRDSWSDLGSMVGIDLVHGHLAGHVDCRLNRSHLNSCV